MIPISWNLSKRTSVLRALFPDMSIAEIEGLSATVIIKAFPSLPIWISSNCYEAKSAFVISTIFLSSILSPTEIGIVLKILPVETLWSPAIRISLTIKDSNAYKEETLNRRNKDSACLIRFFNLST